MTRKRKTTYYVYHAGTDTLIDAADGTFVFSDEDFSDEEREALDDNPYLAKDVGVRLTTLIRAYEKLCAEEAARAKRTRKKNGKKGRK